MILKFTKFKNLLLKFILFIVIFIAVYFLSKVSLLITGIEKRFCSISYSVKMPIYIELFEIELKRYILKNIFSDFKEYGISFKGDMKWDKKIYYINFGFSEKIPEEKKIIELNNKLTNGLIECYEFATKTHLYYLELRKLYVTAETNESFSFEQVYNEMIKESNYKNVFTNVAPKLLIGGPDVRVIKKLHPILREATILIFSFFIAVTILLIWVSRENE